MQYIMRMPVATGNKKEGRPHASLHAAYSKYSILYRLILIGDLYNPQGVFLHIKIDPYLHHLQSTEEKAFGIRTSTSTYIPNREKMM